MIKGLAAWVLNNYLGKYVENLNTDQLSIALSQGLVELENLPLRKDALRQYGVPIEVRAGFVGKVKLQIPVRQIRSAPWLIVIEQLYLVAGPVSLSQWDEQSEEQAALDYKLSALDALEASWRAATENANDTGYYASSYTSWMSYGTGLVTNIVENLQLHIKDVHIRYEDSVTIPGSCFACGVTIDSLTAESCDSNWLARFVSDSCEASYKLCALSSLAVYWDRLQPQEMFGDLTLGELAVAMATSASGGRKQLLAPVSGQARIRRNRSEQPLRSKNQPRLVCDLTLDQVALQLTDWQYGQMVGCAKGLQFIERSRRFRKWRPLSTITEDPQAWWLYAGGCLVRGLRHKELRSWACALRCARENVEYVATYARTLSNAAVSTDAKQAKESLEVERSLDTIRALREVAMRRVRPPAPPPALPPDPPVAGRSVLLQWFPQWWGWYSTPDPAQDASSTGNAHLEEEILEALADSVENNTVLKRDVVFAQLSFTLKQGIINLCSSLNSTGDSEPAMELEFEAMTHRLEYRPRTSSHKYSVSLGSVTLRDRLTKDTMFPMLVAPMSKDALGFRLKRLGRQANNDPLFQMSYEHRPFNSAVHYKLDVKTQSLDVVYNPAATEWLKDFFTRPHQAADWQLREAARYRYERVKRRTKQELMKNWQHILQGHLSDRKTWEIDLDVSAPQIILVEHFCDKNAVIVVVDFGKFHFTNRPEVRGNQSQPTIAVTSPDSDEEDAFMTPCSTPPGSEASDSDPEDTTVVAAHEETSSNSFSDVTLHDKLYDRYSIELSELQILVGRARDNWKFAHLKGTSALHVLDRFNISLRLERRLVYTSDPHFPSLTLAGNLPKLVVHVNEQKIEALTTMMQAVRGQNAFRSPDGCGESLGMQEAPTEDANEAADTAGKELSRLLMLQFTVDHLALEVQSRGRSIAELQVSGVKATLMKRPYDSSISLSVHSLLLVDALQTFGPDFELLVASHKHVGMDSVSGSLRDSEPTSPTSPGSPDPTQLRVTSPMALTQALSSLQCDTSPAQRAVSPTWGIPSPPHAASSPPLSFRPPTIEPLDAEALITVEVVLVSPECPSNDGQAMQVASIQFNNLDVIANQETLVELVGFTQRVMNRLKSVPARASATPMTAAQDDAPDDLSPGSEDSADIPGVARTEITFDFHRLNVLLLRAVVKDNALLGRKIATATMTEARIQATIGNGVLVQGSLGGLQVLDLTPEGVKKHQRILSLGKDPLVDSDMDLLTCLNAGLYSMSSAREEEKRAFSFVVKRDLTTGEDVESADVTVRMASVWYTHSTRFINELQSCATEFKQYLSNLARSIRSAATEMAIGLVHARAEALAQSLNMNARLSTPGFGSSVDISTPKRSRRSFSHSLEMLDSGTRGANTPYTPGSPGDHDQLIIRIRLDVVLDTPVVVLPRSPTSDQVLVAHLGKITVNNEGAQGEGRRERYTLEIRDMSLYSLDTAGRWGQGHARLARAEVLYSCRDVGKPVLHDTMLRLVLDRELGSDLSAMMMSEDGLLPEARDTLQITGNVVTPLKVSLSRCQYEQVLESVNAALSSDATAAEPPPGDRGQPLDGIEEEGEAGVSSLNMDPALRARMLQSQQKAKAERATTIKVLFELPVFTVELRADLGHGEQGLVDLSFSDFIVQYDQSHRHETNIQMSLRSLRMEDLQQASDSKHRCLVVSSSVRSNTDRVGPAGCYVSRSMPDIASYARPFAGSYPGSLPDHLETPGFNQRASRVKSACRLQKAGEEEYPSTPPPSPLPQGSPTAMHRHDNLVHIDVTLIDPAAPNFHTRYNAVRRSVNVDFNSLDIVANAESWVVVLDFFGFSSDPDPDPDVATTAEKSTKQTDVVYNTELDVEVRSLTLVLNRPDHEIARANISQLSARLCSRRGGSTLAGRLGSMSLMDLTGGLYRERFMSSTHEALNFHLIRHSAADADFDAHLKLEMASVVYVHTQRFIAEITAFFREFGHLQAIIRAATQGRRFEEHLSRSTRLKLELHAGSPVLLVPLSSSSPEVLVVDLGKLTVANSFKMAGDEGTISVPKQSASFKHSGAAKKDHAACLLDVMLIELVNTDLYAGRKVARDDTGHATLQIGELCVNKVGPALLQEKCHLRIQVDRNLDTHLTRHVPDMSVRGALSTLNGALDLQQYTLIRGLLSYNIGESLEQFYQPTPEEANPQRNLHTASEAWTTMSIHLDLSDVALRLQLSHGDDATPESPLACVNFIKSRLIVETFSDRTQDVDLVSQEILITDTRFQSCPVNKRCNVFPSILRPMTRSRGGSEVVQAEIHHRRRKDYSKFTILLNNMRLMAVLDWWQIVRDFILENAPDPTMVPVTPTTPQQRSDLNEGAVLMASAVGIINKYTPSAAAVAAPFELKLNITDSQVVLVEDTSQWDTNAVILKSTTVLSYRPNMLEKPLSCNLNHLELFSCILHNEEETALSIIDPVTVNMEISRRPRQGMSGLWDATVSPTQDRVLEIQTQQLNVRLSYRDFLMFSAIVNSLPKQTMWAKTQHLIKQQPANVRSHISKLTALGFESRDCATALEQCDGRLDDAALWLIANARPVETVGSGGVEEEAQSPLTFQSVEVKAGHVSVCVIDDCADADVPLLEAALAQLVVQQNIGGAGSAKCVFSSDYFNRVLSGWEPFIEPWRCQVGWDHELSKSLARDRLQMHLSSDEMIRLNLTSTLIELQDSVKKTWTRDYNTANSSGSSSATDSPIASSRRRSPFVPFELLNVTGSRLAFRTLVTTADNALESVPGRAVMGEVEGEWIVVAPGQTQPFTFETRGKVRHRDTHRLRIHQVCAKVDGWRTLPPVSVDKVGVFFRQAKPDAQTVSRVELPEVRAVFEVKLLKDTARKQVTVRSALLLANQLADAVEVKIETSSAIEMKSLSVSPGVVLPIPLSHVMSPLWVRPVSKQQQYRFSKRPITWGRATQPGVAQDEVLQCHSNTSFNYRLCCSVRREHYPADRGAWQQPGHVITLSSPVSLINLLPVEMHYALGGANGRVKPGARLDMHHVDTEKVFEVHVSLENYPTPGTLFVPCPCSSFSARVRLMDQNQRRLNLNADVKVNKGAGIVIALHAGYWISNKTELPLVFRQEGNPTETAGQFEEHEMARMVAPLLFSFTDHVVAQSTTIVARIGGAYKPYGVPQWCEQFHLQPGIQLRRLRISHHQRPDFVYVIGIEVRRGRGRYRNTSIVTLLPRYQLHNRSQYRLQFAQKCFATTLNDPHFKSTYLLAVSNCSLPFHWPRLDKDPLLCLRLADASDTGTSSMWSGGFRIDSADSFHVNVLDLAGRPCFLRVEVVLSRATYFVVFTDAGQLPPPLRIDNFSHVALTFYQSHVAGESLHSTARPHTVVPYAWHEPTLAPHITLVAPGGAAASYDMTRTGEALHLTYENFIYIALTATFKNVGALDPLDVESQQLVLAADGCRVVLARKQHGARWQLWRMTSEGLLQHEGSSPPREKNKASENTLVLDISGTAPQPSQCCSLALRRPDRRRQSTQTWRFTDDGRLCCAHNNMCVQAKDGFFGLREGHQIPGPGASWQMWSEAVLGPPQVASHRTTEWGVPLEQAVSSQRLRPGSGYLMVQVKMDGPTRVLEVRDIKEKRLQATADERDWTHISVSQRPTILHDESTRVVPPDTREMELRLELPAGLGISLVSHLEELIFARLAGINLLLVWTPAKSNCELSVKDIQCDNQQLEAQCPVVLHVTPALRGDDAQPTPALYLNLEKLHRPATNAVIYNHCILKMKNMSLTIEERLLLKLFAFAGWSDGDESEREDVDEIEFETQRLLSEALSLTAKRFYFGALQLQLSQVRLSVITTPKLQYQLSELKKKLGLRLIKFEDAAVELQPFVKNNSFETGHFLVISVLKHYKEELKWQAASILGSVDFLGNPLGFMQDVSEGVTGLIRDGNVVTLVKNVTHGLSNSAAKVTESLSDGLGRVILDDSHEEARHRIRRSQDGSSADHLVAGLKGLGFGLLGGVTSVFKQSYDGAYREGVQGFISGFGKGLVGTVTKPVVGVLDLASETASAVRDSSRSSSRQLPARLRLPRCVIGPGGLLPHYTKKSAQGQEFLYVINNRNYVEMFLSYEILRSGSEDLRIVVSSDYVRVFTCGTGNTCVVVQCHLRDLHHCLPLAVLSKPSEPHHREIRTATETHYIELTMRVDEQNLPSQMLGAEPIRKPQVRCDSAAVAHSVAQMVNYAKQTHDERYYSLVDDSEGGDEWLLV